MFYRAHRFISATKISEEEFEDIADVLGASAVIVQDLKQKRKKHYKFDWDKMLQFKGRTGVYLQYAHARLCKWVTAHVCRRTSLDNSIQPVTCFESRFAAVSDELFVPNTDLRFLWKWGHNFCSLEKNCGVPLNVDCDTKHLTEECAARLTNHLAR